MTPEPAPSTEPPSPQTPPESNGAYGAFTRDELAQICIDATASAFDSGVRFDAKNTRVEPRSVTPEWLVIVPARTGEFDAHSLCTIDGTPSAPVLEMASGSISELPEAQIQRLIRGENEGGDQ